MAKINDQYLDIEIKERDVFANFKVSVQIKRDWRGRIGLFFIKIGCKLSGAQFVEEFPVSLIQNDQPVEIDNG